MRCVRLAARSHDYEVLIEEGLLDRLGELVMQLAPNPRAMLVADRAVESTHAAAAAASLRAAGYDVAICSIEAAEEEKSPKIVTHLQVAMARHGLERRSPVIAVGGGIVGDVAGFAASTYMRGVPIVQCPTTLLSMVDASVGGKTGVNLRLGDGALAKNMVGAFWPPRLVAIDPRSLWTLPRRHLVCGLSECIKHGIIADAGLLSTLESSMSELLGLDSAAMASLIERNVAIKAEIVGRDEREEHDVRALLNLGHTFGHAFESQRELALLHGEAVAVGIVAACHVAVALGRLAEAERDRVVTILRRATLPVALEHSVAPGALLAAMRHDKKVQAGRLRLVLPRGLGAADVVDGVAEELVLEALRAVGARG